MAAVTSLAAGLGPRTRLAVAVLGLGALISLGFLVAGSRAGLVLVPFSIGALVALVLLPFPAADVGLAAGIGATFPLLPPIGLPNLPLGAALVVVAVARLWIQEGVRPSSRALVWLLVLWSPLAVGLALSHWPAPAVFSRPLVVLLVASLASVLGAIVWADARRLRRWLAGLAVGLLVVACSALVVFALQYFLPVPRVVDPVESALGVLRGEAAAAKFDSGNNWLILGSEVTLRAVSPLVPSPNNLGGYLGLVGPLVAAAWLTGRDRPGAVLSLLAVATAVAAISVTYSRSSWLAAMAGVAVAATILLLPAARSARSAIGSVDRKALAALSLSVLVGLGIGALGVVSAGQPSTLDRVEHPLEDPSVTTRLEINGEALAAIEADPLHGAGLGNWNATLRLTGSDRAYIHNVYLEYGAAAGILGIVWAVLLVAMPMAAALTMILRRRSSVILAAGLLVAATFTAVQFLFDDNLLNPQYAWLLLFVVGGAVGARQQSDTTLR